MLEVGLLENNNSDNIDYNALYWKQNECVEPVQNVWEARCMESGDILSWDIHSDVFQSEPERPLTTSVIP